ncbi:hypothetical protein [Shewanella fodinae]|jgi:predicted CopG family antitoxin|uniref:Uncharacterized protein n=1 Tax=Shewanella fodinae TaxID=552357 RepID=A0A4R2FDC4_9GAMM|nr:hypothetical protein [Shewanella fodinae]TCN77725.1 hypothetical protein EDC91_14426 [Shewanella fodinae]
MKDITTAESVYLSLKAMERAVQAFADVADDWCEDDPKQALVQLLSENLTQQLQAHQQAVYGALSSIQPLAAA